MVCINWIKTLCTWKRDTRVCLSEEAMVLLHYGHGSHSQHSPLSGPHRDFRMLADKPIVRSPRPQDFNKELLALTSRWKAQGGGGGKGSRLLERRWTSTSRGACEECALPVPVAPAPCGTLESCADSVKHRARKYHPSPAAWQRYAREWDVVQLRRKMEATHTVSLPEIPEYASMVATDPPAATNTHKQEEDPSTFVRAMPGYGGFVPRHAVEGRPLADQDCSTSRSTYRRFPSGEYRELAFAHRGPLSKTVTLTYPFNAFNKVE